MSEAKFRNLASAMLHQCFPRPLTLWRQMVEGDKWEMYIPSDLAYGEDGQPAAGIEGGDCLIFTMEIIKIKGDTTPQKIDKSKLAKSCDCGTGPTEDYGGMEFYGMPTAHYGFQCNCGSPSHTGEEGCCGLKLGECDDYCLDYQVSEIVNRKKLDDGRIIFRVKLDYAGLYDPNRLDSIGNSTGGNKRWLDKRSVKITDTLISKFKASRQEKKDGQAAKKGLDSLLFTKDSKTEPASPKEMKPLNTVAEPVFDIDQNNFETLIDKSDDVWMVEFGSDMCGSCAAFSPIYHQLAEAHPTIKSGYVNIDNGAGMDLARKLDIMSGGIPTVAVFSQKNRGPSPIMRGAPLPLAELTELLDKQLEGLAPGADGWLVKL